MNDGPRNEFLKRKLKSRIFDNLIQMNKQNNQPGEEIENSYMLVHPNVLRLDNSKSQNAHYKFNQMYS